MKKLVIVLGLGLGLVLGSCGKEVRVEKVSSPTPTPTVIPHTPLGGVPTWRREDPPPKCPMERELLALSRVQGDFIGECLALLQRKEVNLKECVDLCVR